MKLVSPSSAFGALTRLLTAAVLVAIVAVGAPLHSHDASLGDDRAAAQKAPCSACVTNASPGLVLERADLAPHLEALDLVIVEVTGVSARPLSVRSGRAPPAA